MSDEPDYMRQYWASVAREKREALEAELASVVHPEAFDPHGYVEDVPVAQAEARLIAGRVISWLEGHDRQVADRAWKEAQRKTGQVLLNLLPPSPYNYDDPSHIREGQTDDD